MPPTVNLKSFVKSYTWLLRIGLTTGGVIIGFRIISLLVIYRYVQLDYYLSLVAVAFLLTGLFINRSSAKIETTAGHPGPVSLPARPSESEAPSAPSAVSEPVQELLVLLTSKEFLVLRLLAEGKTNKEIAVLHCVELSTVKTHVNNLYAKLNVSNRAQARARYVEMTQKLPIS